MTRRRGTCPLEGDDMLREILLRLPPQPSSLPRASAVCKRWRVLVTDSGFLRCFYARHRNPPLLGVFFHHGDKIKFTSVLPAPDHIPDGHFDLPTGDFSGRLLGCRHGLVLILHQFRTEVLVCDPITGNQHRVPIPPELKCGNVYGAVYALPGHVHGDCHSTLFKVVLLLVSTKHGRALASFYSSETDTWADLIEAQVQYQDCFGGYISTLVGNVVYWSFKYVNKGILAFDLERQSLDVLEGPPNLYRSYSHQIIQTEDGAVGVAMMMYHHHHNIEMWQRKINRHGVATCWVLWKTVDTDNFLGLPPRVEEDYVWWKFIRGYVKDTDEIFLYVKGNVYVVQLNSMQSRRFCENRHITSCHSLKSSYAPELSLVRVGVHPILPSTTSASTVPASQSHKREED